MMKRICIVIVSVFVAVFAKAEVEFAYEAGAELVTAYMWRGQNCGGLSLQPDLQIGYDGEHTALRFGTWWSIGSSDWQFNNNTYFGAEMDWSLQFRFYGAFVGMTQLYFFDDDRDPGDCSPFLGWNKSVEQLYEENFTSQTEIQVGYDFGELLNVPLTITWGTCVAGADFLESEDEEGNTTVSRAYSSYIELAYTHEFDHGVSLGGTLGFSPWRSEVYANEKFALINIAARVDKVWELDVCELDLFAQASINPDGINKQNAITLDKSEQHLNGCIGFGVWF